MRTVVVCWALAGCFSKPPAPSTDDGGGGPDADPKSGCAEVPFGGRTEMILGSQYTSDPTMTADQLELFFVSDPGDQATWVIRSATRSLPNDPFTIGVPASFDEPTFRDQDPSITADGLMIVFSSRRSSADRAWFATRATRTSSWSLPSQVPGLESVSIINLDLSADGLELYFPDTQRALRHATRASRSAQFAIQPGPPLASDVAFPTVSTDGLELYSNGVASTLTRATRKTTADVFSAGTEALANAYDADLLPDGRTLVATVGGGVLGVFRRDCPP